MSEPSRRQADDRCPGVFDPHPAADGALVRIRLLGGRLTPAQMLALSQVSAEWGDGFLELTARGNVQVRGIDDVETAGNALSAAGLVPSTSHEKVRNIEMSPLTGRLGGSADVAPIATALDEALRADDGLADLSGRFLFGVDDGRGDVVARRPDICAVAWRDRTNLGADLVIDGSPAGSVSDLSAAADAMVAVARDMRAMVVPAVPGAQRVWRIRDLDAQTRRQLIESARQRLDRPRLDKRRLDERRRDELRRDRPGSAELRADPTVVTPDATGGIVGWFEQGDGGVLLGGVVELGRIPSRLAEFLAAIGAPMVITPDREILICDLTEGVAETVVRVLAPMGLIFDAASAWVQVSSCAGAPGCASAHAPVREDLRRRVESGREVAGREHWVGCSRGCGSPAGAYLRVEAGPDGYRETHRPG